MTNIREQEIFGAFKRTILNALNDSYEKNTDFGAYDRRVNLARVTTPAEFHDDADVRNRIISEKLDDGSVRHHLRVLAHQPDGSTKNWWILRILDSQMFRTVDSNIELCAMTLGRDNSKEVFMPAQNYGHLKLVYSLLGSENTMEMYMDHYLYCTIDHFWDAVNGRSLADTDASDYINAHSDKCNQYKDRWEKAGVPFNRGALIYMLSYLPEYFVPARDNNVCDWVIEKYTHWLPEIILAEARGGLIDVSGRIHNEYISEQRQNYEHLINVIKKLSDASRMEGLPEGASNPAAGGDTPVIRMEKLSNEMVAHLSKCGGLSKSLRCTDFNGDAYESGPIKLFYNTRHKLAVIAG